MCYFFHILTFAPCSSTATCGDCPFWKSPTCRWENLWTAHHLAERKEKRIALICECISTISILDKGLKHFRIRKSSSPHVVLKTLKVSCLRTHLYAWTHNCHLKVIITTILIPFPVTTQGGIKIKKAIQSQQATCNKNNINYI